jgi:hypothetical protein
MAKKYPGKVSEAFPNGKNWHVIEPAGMSTAGTVRVDIDPEAMGSCVELEWSRADLFLTTPDGAHDYNGFAALRVRLSPAEAQELVSRVLVAMACVESEAS